MYKLLEHSIGVKTYAINDNEGLAIIKDNSFYLKQNDIYVKYYDFPKPMQELYFSHNFYTNSDEGDGFVFVDGRIIEIEGGVTCCISKEKVAVYKRINEKKEFFIYDISKKSQELIKYRISRQDSFVKGVIYQELWPSKTLLVKISLINYQINWQFDLKTLGKYFEKEYEITKVIGIHNGELLVGCNNTVLLAIDPETGRIIQQWKEQEETDDVSFTRGKIGNYTSCVLLPNENKLMGCGYEFIWEIDLITREVLVHDLKEKFKQNAIEYLSGHKPGLNDTHYLLTAYSVYDLDKKIKRYPIIFALNKETIEIDWVYNFESSLEGVFKETKIAGNKLYQLCSTGDLFIFERTV